MSADDFYSDLTKKEAIELAEEENEKGGRHATAIQLDDEWCVEVYYA